MVYSSSSGSSGSLVGGDFGGLGDGGSGSGQSGGGERGFAGGVSGGLICVKGDDPIDGLALL